MLNRRKLFEVSAVSLSLAAMVHPAVGSVPAKPRIRVSPAMDGLQGCADGKQRVSHWAQITGKFDDLVEYDMRFAEYWRPLRRDLPDRDAILVERRKSVENDMPRRLAGGKSMIFAAGLTPLGDAAWGHKCCVAQMDGVIEGKLPEPQPPVLATNEGCDSSGAMRICVWSRSAEPFWWFELLYRDMVQANYEWHLKQRVPLSHSVLGDVSDPVTLRGVAVATHFCVQPDSPEYAALREATDCWMYGQGFLLPLETTVIA